MDYGKETVIINVYAPHLNAIEVFAPLLDRLSSLSFEILICRGDFNVHLDPQKDKKGSTTTHISKHAELISIFLQEQDWIELWRYFNPDHFQYTYKCKKPQVMTRLDYF